MRNHLGPLLLALALSAVPLSSADAFTYVYTSESAFRDNLAAGAVTEDFESIPEGPFGATTFNRDAFSFIADAPPDGLFGVVAPTGMWLSTSTATDALTFTFTAGSPRAVGGYFFLTDELGEPGSNPAYTLRVAINDGTFIDIPAADASSPTNFVGFASEGAITTLSISVVGLNPDAPLWPTASNLILGQPLVVPPAVPEPSSLASIALGSLAGVAFLRRRSRV